MAQAALGAFVPRVSRRPTPAGCAQARPGGRNARAIPRSSRTLLTRMAENSADFTLTFRRLCDAATGGEAIAGADAVRRSRRLRLVGGRWRRRLAKETAGPDERAPRCGRSIPPSSRATICVEAAIDAAVDAR